LPVIQPLPPSHCSFIKIFLLAVDKKRFGESLWGKNKFNRDRTFTHRNDIYTLFQKIEEDFLSLLGNREGIGYTYTVIYEENARILVYVRRRHIYSR
jgi:hypothetical protein